jgi:hypothetical protein
MQPLPLGITPHKARAALHVPNGRVTTLAAGHSPSAMGASSCPPRSRACVLDQSYAAGRRPWRTRGSLIAASTRSRVQRSAIARGWHALR